MMEESLNDSSITEEHHILLGAILKIIQSVDSGLKEAFKGLLTGFKDSSSAATPNAGEFAHMNQKLKSSQEELGLLKKWFDDAQVVIAEVENLKAEMKKARQEAVGHKLVAE
ncbi:hypothetical protein D1007_32996 [Hordeum vulgare]|nr:hypothetical protein D1007_32996 [Hordeum vulgare]